MTTPLKFGLIGCGAQGHFLSEALKLTGQAELVACADVNAAAAERAVARCGYRQAYLDAEELLSKADVEAVIVATVHDQLQSCGMSAVGAGKHLFIEKPMALDARSGHELVQACQSTGRKLMVGYTLPFMAPRVRLRQLIQQGAMGDLAHIVAGQIIGRLTGWLADPKHGGGALFYVGVHAIYQVLHVIERRAERVFAHVTMSDSGVDESCTLTIDFEGGLSAQIVTSQRFDGRYGWLDVIGTQGRVRSEWERQELTVQSNVLEAYRHETVIHVPEDCIGPDVEAGDAASVMAHKYIRAWASEFQQFIAAIREDHDPPVSGTHAVDVLKITDAVLDSGRRGTPVELA